MIDLGELPEWAAWRHVTAREGFEVVWFRPGRIDGCTTGVEYGYPWVVEYGIDVGPGWRTRSATVRQRSAAGVRTLTLSTDGAGHWLVDGEPAPALDGCTDVDLESSVVTNTLPAHRFAGLDPSAGPQPAPAAYVRAADLSVQRLEQTYAPRPGPGLSYDYLAAEFDADFVLDFDGAGLVRDYPYLATRVA